MTSVRIYNDCDAGFSSDEIESAMQQLVERIENYFSLCLCGEETLDAAYLQVTRAYLQLGSCIEDADIGPT